MIIPRIKPKRVFCSKCGHTWENKRYVWRGRDSKQFIKDVCGVIVCLNCGLSDGVRIMEKQNEVSV